MGRLFVGIPIAPELRDGLQAHLRGVFGERMPGRAVPPGNWHLTLRFLGDVDAGRHRALLAELETVRAHPFVLSLAGLGAFPRSARASVLWVGAGEGEAELRSLAARVEKAAVRAGFAAEPRPYSPHLTLSRLNPPADVRRPVEHAPAFGGRMRVDGFVLFRSHLGGGPPRYERLCHFPLAGYLQPKRQSMANERLSDERVAELIDSRLRGWKHENGYLARTYATDNWSRTMMLANAIAYLGEKAWHHPDLFLSYPSAKVLLTTHDAGGVTERDVALAEEIEKLARWLPDPEVFKGVEHWFD